MSPPVTRLILPLLCWATPLAAQLALQVGGGYLDRRLADGAAVERQAGMIGGAALTVGGAGLEISLSAVGGKLAAKTSGTDDADYARITADLSLALTTWIAAVAGAGASVYVTPVGAQRWILPRIGVELRAPFANIPGTAYFAGAALVGAKTNAVAPPRGGMDVRAGVTIGPTPVGIYLEYHLERIRFAAVTGREEQLGEIRAGVRIAR